ncbi:MAG: hypothetical protein GTO02_00290, partial [Candidatus Dadabacteria bacterium]|nr:hypothetical protein [Candidatus Dadabacteria bacterium]NIQ12888.1 hypothetical protein [Candidatus Dadabacteria bacterium]
MNNITKVNELIVYRKRREPALGVLSSISDRKISLFCEDGKEHSIDIKKILLNTGIIFSDKLNRSEKKLELRKYRKNLEAVKSEVDLKIIWECFGETPYQVKFTEIIELYFGDTNISEIEKLNLFWAIDKDVIYFTRLEDGYMPNSKDEIDKKIELSRVKKEKEKHRESAVKWAKSILNEEIEPKINNHFKDFIDLIEGYALNLDRYDRAKEAKEFLHDIKLKDIESAVEFLIKIGVWNENDDQISRKYYSSSFTSKRSQKELEELLNLDQSLNGFKDHTDLAIYSIDDKGTADIDDAIS